MSTSLQSLAVCCAIIGLIVYYLSLIINVATLGGVLVGLVYLILSSSKPAEEGTEDQLSTTNQTPLSTMPAVDDEVVSDEENSDEE